MIFQKIKENFIDLILNGVKLIGSAIILINFRKKGIL